MYHYQDRSILLNPIYLGLKDFSDLGSRKTKYPKKAKFNKFLDNKLLSKNFVYFFQKTFVSTYLPAKNSKTFFKST